MDKFYLQREQLTYFNSLCGNNTVAFVNIFKEQKGDETIWKGYSSKDNHATFAYCREIFYSNLTSLLHKKGLLLEDVRLAIVIPPFMAKKLNIAINVLNILEMRYKWKKTKLIQPSVVVVDKDNSETKLTALKFMAILDSPNIWITNSIINSIYTLYIRLALTSNIYDGVKTYSDIKKVNKKIVLDSRINKKESIRLDAANLRLINIKSVPSDHFFIIRSSLTWDFFIKNMEKLMYNNINMRAHGSMGIERLVYSVLGSNYDVSNKLFLERVDCNKLRTFLTEQKLVKYEVVNK